MDICNTVPQPKLLSGKPITKKIISIVQLWEEQNNNVYIPNNRSKLSYIKHKKLKETISLNSVLYDNNLNDTLKYNGSKEIISHLKSSIPVDNILYLVPDSINDFLFENIRSSINLNYKNNAKPLPNSIGAIFSLFNKKNLENSKNGDLFIVVEAIYNCISCTPVKAEKNKKKEISFTRYPSIFINENTSIQDPLSNKIFSILGNKTKDDFVFKTENKQDPYLWKNIIDQVQNMTKKRTLPQNVSDTISHMAENKNITLITVNNDFTLKNLKTKSTIKIKDNDLINGAIILSNLETKNKKKIYWKDHLPALFTKLPNVGTFNFIQDQTIEPIRGKAISIKNNEIFTLPTLAENTNEWAFPLYIDKEKRPKYQAVIPKPLYINQEIDAKLEMIYTYGNDMPFELYFKPINTEYDTMKVKWQEYKIIEKVSTLVPQFPKSNDNSRHINKYDELIKSMENMRYLDFDKHDFYTNDIQYKNKPNIMFIDNHCLNTNCVTVDIKEHEEFIYAYLRYDSKYENYPIVVADHNIDKLTKKMEKVIRGKRYFPIDLWINNNYYLAEDTPKNLQTTLKTLFDEVKDLRDNNNDFYDELLDYLCIFHQDMPSYAIDDILEGSSTSKYYIDHKWKSIARAIGTCNQSWQKDMFFNCLTKLEEKKQKQYIIKILSVVLWRNEDLYLELKDKQIEVILQYVGIVIKTSNTQKIFMPKKITKKKNGDIIIHAKPEFITLVHSLELLLNLIRLRKHKNPAISSKFNINSEFSLNLIDYIDNIIDIYSKLKSKEKNIANFKDESKMQIDLSKNKPKAYKNTPDLLYSIKMYLSGDNGANSIILKGVID